MQKTLNRYIYIYMAIYAQSKPYIRIFMGSIYMFAVFIRLFMHYIICIYHFDMLQADVLYQYLPGRTQ